MKIPKRRAQVEPLDPGRVYATAADAVDALGKLLTWLDGVCNARTVQGVVTARVGSHDLRRRLNKLFPRIEVLRDEADAARGAG